MEDLKQYFANAEGLGVLATSGKDGSVNAAVFSRPHFLEDGAIAFIMPERLTYRNLSENPHAHFLFHESGPGYKGWRLYLVKTGQETDTERLESLRRHRRYKDDDGHTRHLVFFRVEKALPLVGTGA